MQPEPFVPPDVDLRDFPYMPLDIARLFGSAFHAQATDSEWRAGVTLWLKSWHQVPAASLPSDDVSLARLAELGRDLKGWRRIREGALHGWTACSDGRLYHRTVAEKALQAWQSKCARRDRTRKAREVLLLQRQSQTEIGSVTDQKSSVTNGSTEPVTGSKGEGEGKRRDKTSNSSSNGSMPRDPPNARPADHVPAAAALAVIAEFDASVARHWGEAQRRPWPAANDGVTAQRWLDAGATPGLCRAVIEPGLQRLKAKGREPPRSLAFFDDEIRAAIRSAPPADPPGNDENRPNAKALAWAVQFGDVTVPEIQRLRSLQKAGLLDEADELGRQYLAGKAA